MPTIAGLRRRGYTPESIRLMCERAGTSKAGGWTDYASLETALRDDLDPKAPRAMAVLDPVRLRARQLGRRLRQRGASRALPCAGRIRSGRSSASARSRSAPSSGSSATTSPRCRPKGFFRLFPGNRVRLKYGYVIECTGCEKDADGTITDGARDARRRHEERHAGRRRGQGQGHDHLGRRARCARRPRCASTTACSSTSSPTPAASDLMAEPQPAQQEGRHRDSSSPRSRDGARGRQLPVRAPRLLRRRPRRPSHRTAGLQPDRRR